MGLYLLVTHSRSLAISESCFCRCTISSFVQLKGGVSLRNRCCFCNSTISSIVGRFTNGGLPTGLFGTVGVAVGLTVGSCALGSPFGLPFATLGCESLPFNSLPSEGVATVFRDCEATFLFRVRVRNSAKGKSSDSSSESSAFTCALVRTRHMHGRSS